MSTTSIASYIAETARKSGVSVELALYVADHENNFSTSTPGDMFYKEGKLVWARGVWQITKFYHPEVTEAQAFDVTWSTNWAMPFLKDKDTCRHMWTTCRWFYDGK